MHDGAQVFQIIGRKRRARAEQPQRVTSRVVARDGRCFEDEGPAAGQALIAQARGAGQAGAAAPLEERNSCSGWGRRGRVENEIGSERARRQLDRYTVARRPQEAVQVSEAGVAVRCHAVGACERAEQLGVDRQRLDETRVDSELNRNAGFATTRHRRYDDRITIDAYTESRRIGADYERPGGVSARRRQPEPRARSRGRRRPAQGTRSSVRDLQAHDPSGQAADGGRVLQQRGSDLENPAGRRL